MKKILLGFLMLSCCMLFADDENFIVYRGKCKLYNDVVKGMSPHDVYVNYNAPKKRIELYLESWSGKTCIKFNQKDKAIFTNAIQKYFEWSKKAIEKQVKLEKNIDESNADLMFYYGDSWYQTAPYYKNFNGIQYSFFSQNEKIHQFVISISKLESSDNEFITMASEQYYFDNGDAASLLSAFRDDFIMDAIQKAKEKNKAINDDFK